MRRFASLLAALLCAPLWTAPAVADSVPSTPAPSLTPLSYPKVTPDASFTDPTYLHKWPHITLAETRRLMKKRGTVLVDGRSMTEWEQSHLPGALPLPLGEFDKNYDRYKSKLRHAKVIIAYCHGKGCHLSDALCQRLVDKGYTNVAVFWGGFPEWTQNHLPLVDKYGQPVPDSH